MNFDFLKGLKGLEVAYGPCKDAEELLKLKPYWSMVASRKGAELLAKFIYMAAHYSAAEQMTFSDILYDPLVQKYINDRSVLREFHHIRKSGNTAVHDSDDEINEDDAIIILKELHHIAGETAKCLNLIDSYPQFDDNIDEYPDAKLNEVMITEKAQEMFIKYLLAEQEKHRVSFNDKNKSHMDFFKKSIVEMHEYLEFDCPVNMNTTTEYIRRYLTYIVNAAVMPVKDEYDKEAPWNDLQATITLKVNETKYSLRKEDHLSGKFPEEMIHGLEALKHAQLFSIDIHADGNLRGFYYLVVDKETNEQLRTIDEESPWMGHGMSEYMRFIMRRENFTYKGILIYNTYNYDSEVYYIRDGKSYNIEDISSPNIVSEQDGSIWTGSSIILVVDFDFDAHPDIIEQLHEVVRSSVPQDQLSYIEDVWEEEEQGILLNGTDWKTNDLSIVQDFLNKINSILEPIAETCSYIIEHCWYNLDEFEVAYIQVINNKLRISGKRF